MNILITGATGMFGGNLVKSFSQLDNDIHIKALVRNAEKAKELGLNSLKNVEVVIGDMTKPESLNKILSHVNRIFLVSPMIDGLDKMEINMINAAKNSGVQHIFKIHGAVKHNNDYLSQLHERSIAYLKSSGLNWTLISPNSVMETSLIPLRDSILELREIHSCTSHHKIGLIALEDVLRVSVKLMLSNFHEGKEYLLTGPEAIDYYQLAEFFTNVLGKKIQYIDHSEQEFENILIEFTGQTKETVEMSIMCHLRAWNKDGADLVTSTVYDITGLQPMSVEKWIEKNKTIYQ